MQPNIRVMLFDEDGERFFGEGPCRLLHAIEQTGSLRAAAQSMQMAYTKALGLVRHAEQVLGFALTERKIGGKGGGGSVLTDEAKEFLYRYEQYRDACKQAGKQLYPQFFPDEKGNRMCDHGIRPSKTVWLQQAACRIRPKTAALPCVCRDRGVAPRGRYPLDRGAGIV